MGGPPNSQVAPLPRDLPFRLVSKTIGSGAYAAIRKAVPLKATKPVIAVKFINKEHAFRTGHVLKKQLALELSLHKSVSGHANIIRYLSHGENPDWIWLCMELAEGGDLFDKIEADEGVDESVAHFYFAQLVAAIDWCHAKGVAHRDVKPENMLLSGEGDLKLADFGMATQFSYKGEKKMCGLVCGSPPYIAPEILQVGQRNQKRRQGEDKVGYDPQSADVWSCAIVLFVLLAGNTPWDEPNMETSYEFNEYVRNAGKADDELWEKVPTDALSLVRGMLKTNVPERFTLDLVKKHPWFRKPNPHLSEQGTAADPVGLATQMLGRLHISFDKDASASQLQRQTSYPTPDSMELDAPAEDSAAWARISATQPDAPITPFADHHFDWEAPSRLDMSSSQPTNNPSLHLSANDFLATTFLAEDPSMSQFTSTPGVPLSLTQFARKFADIIPSHSLARFLSVLPLRQLVEMLTDALHRLNIPTPDVPLEGVAKQDGPVRIRFRALDSRKQPLHGSVIVENLDVGQQVGGMMSGVEVLEVRFVKAKGDPLEWRRLFKKVVLLCEDGVVKGTG